MKNYLARKTHFVRLLSFVLIVIGIIAILSWQWLQSYCLNWIKAILDCEAIYPVIIAGSILLGLYYSMFYVRVGKSKEISLLKIFGPLFDPPVISLAYGLALTSTLSLFRGIFKQLFFHQQYFVRLENIDIATLMLVCIPLVIWSVSGLVTFIVAVFGKNEDEAGIVQVKDNPNSEN